MIEKNPASQRQGNAVLNTIVWFRQLRYPVRYGLGGKNPSDTACEISRHFFFLSLLSEKIAHKKIFHTNRRQQQQNSYQNISKKHEPLHIITTTKMRTRTTRATTKESHQILLSSWRIIINIIVIVSQHCCYCCSCYCSPSSLGFSIWFLIIDR